MQEHILLRTKTLRLEILCAALFTACDEVFDFDGGNDRWQTVNNEMWILMDGRDDVSRVARFIIGDDELIRFPGFAESTRFHRVTE